MVVLLVVCLAIVLYTYLGYPILIACLARLFPKKIRRDPGYTPMVSALIPVFNAETYIRAKLDSLLALDYPQDKFEILVTSDASDDGSDAILQEYADQHPQIHFTRMKQRSGKPTQVNLMKERAKGEVLLMTDIRQPLNKQALRELVSRLADPDVAAVSGNLVLEGGQGAGVYWAYENAIRRAEGRFRSMVGVTGPIYAIAKSDMGDIPNDLILDDMWIPMTQRLEGKRIVFAEGAVAMDDAFADKREFGRKVRTLAGNYQLFRLLPALLNPFKNPSWFEVMSHKVCRLICPWALIGLFFSNSFLAFCFCEPRGALAFLLKALFGAQCLFYCFSLVGRYAGPIGKICRTFVVMNWAALLGFWRFIRSTQKVTW